MDISINSITLKPILVFNFISGWLYRCCIVLTMWNCIRLCTCTYKHLQHVYTHIYLFITKSLKTRNLFMSCKSNSIYMSLSMPNIISTILIFHVWTPCKTTVLNYKRNCNQLFNLFLSVILVLLYFVIELCVGRWR